MITKQELKTGMKLRFNPKSELIYVIEGIGSDWIVMKNMFGPSQMYFDKDFNFKDAKIIKPKHKVFVRLYRNRNGEIYSKSRALKSMENALVSGKMIADIVVEIEEGEGL